MKSLLNHINVGWITPNGTHINIGTVFGDSGIKWEITEFVEDGMNYRIIENGSWPTGVPTIPTLMTFKEAECIDHYRIWKP